MLISAGVIVLVFSACLGAGAAVLTLVRLLPELDWGERVAWSFAVGIGAFGWAVFFPAVFGRIGPTDMLVLCFLCTAGMIFLRRPLPTHAKAEPLDGIGWTLCGAIMVVLAFDLLEGISPPADADSLAYHFALPQRFLAAGGLDFVPKANDSAAPLLLHMSYLVALGLGGEKALTLWTMVSGGMSAAVVFCVCRRHIGVNWSLATALIFLSTPAVLYGAGTGQVEVRLALFVPLAAVCVAKALRAGDIRYAMLAGLMSGFYAGGKFMGLLFAAICGLMIIMQKRWFSRGLAYGIALLAAGFQWYAWNWYNTGDPVFPLLFDILDFPDSDIWNRAHDAFYRETYFTSENPLPHSLYWYLAYPFHAALGLIPEIEAGRTGLGPFALLALPFAAAGAWRYRHAAARSPLAIYAVIALAFYTVWFFGGGSQRVRHLVPLYPLLLICFMAAAARWTRSSALRLPFATAVGLTVVVQLGGQAVFAANYVRHVFSGESRDAFLARNVLRYEPVRWINTNLTREHKILVIDRQLVYPIEIPVFDANPQTQALIELHPGGLDAQKFWKQLKSQGITHLLLNVEEQGDMTAALAMLEKAGCARVAKRITASSFGSRTLSAANRVPTLMAIYALTSGQCRL